MEPIVRLFIFLGIIFFILAGVAYLFGRMGVSLGQLPGDIRWQNGNMTCILALGTSLLLSVVLTVILNIIIRLLNR